MRVLVTCLFVLLVAGSALADTPVCDTTNPCKTIRIANNTGGPIWAIIFTGPKEPMDDWLMAQFKVARNNLITTYKNTKNNTIYVPTNDDGTLDESGIANGQYVEVTVPFYSQLATCAPNSTCENAYSDWWNGGRVLIYDNLAEMQANYATDKGSSVTPLSPGPCIKKSTNNVLGPCKSPLLLRPLADPVNINHMQLHEYSFGAANPAPPTNTAVQFVINTQLAGYNISSVDSVYLPTAMEPFANPLIRYIGSVISPKLFSEHLSTFVKDDPPTGFKGWPTFAAKNNIPVNPDRPRVPGAYNVFADEWANLFPPYSYPNPAILAPNCVTTPWKDPEPGIANCPPVERMYKLYKRCRAAVNPPANDICNAYQAVLALFDKNFQLYKGLSCQSNSVTNDEITILKKLYGWVQWNEFCGAGANALKDSLGVDKFNELLQRYIHEMQYAYRNPNITSADKSDFNPYVQLIHGPNFLNEFAYSFSVDDVFAFQQYIGGGVIITVAGKTGLDNTDLIDTKVRATVTLTTLHPGIKEWNRVGLCSTTANFTDVDPNGPFYPFWPQTDNSHGLGYPCTITATDFKNKTYQFILTAGPPNMAVGCTGVPNLKWCQGVSLVPNGDGGPNQKNQANTPLIDPDPPTSSHDVNGDGVSDIILRHTGGTVGAWLIKNGQFSEAGITAVADPSQSIVGQRDFDRDGKADLLLLKTNGDVELWLMNGTSRINEPPFSPYHVGSVGTGFTVAGTGDFDGANNPGLGGILWRPTTTGDYQVWLMDAHRAPIDGAIRQKGPIPNPGGTWSVAGIADFNGDHNADILWRDSGGNVAIWFMNGVSVVTMADVVKPPDATNWTIVGTGDFNGDGFADILWRHTDGRVGIWLMNGNTAQSKVSFGNPGTNYSVLMTGDFNYDGKSDILWRENGGSVSIWLMNGLAPPQPVPLGTPPSGWTIQAINAD